jgi:hypothetical protein
MRLLVLDVLPRKQKFKQNHFLVMVSPEPFKGNTNSKRKVGKNQIVGQITSPCDIIAAKFESILAGKQ